jgi:lysophospholipase L1-like esterase
MAFHVLAVVTIYFICGTTALQLAGLGSSFAAGPGLRENYARILAGRLNASIADLSVSGSTLLSMGSQISKLPKNADIITITSGGNDLNYIGGLSMGTTGTSSLSEPQFLKRWEDVLANIHTASPKAVVYLVEYLTILGPDVKPGATVSMNAAAVEYHQGVAAKLQRGTAKAAEGKDWVKDVPVAKLSQTHGLGSAEPWVNGAGMSGAKGSGGLGAAWHPNAAGMKAIANILYDTIEKSKASKL